MKSTFQDKKKIGDIALDGVGNIFPTSRARSVWTWIAIGLSSLLLTWLLTRSLVIAMAIAILSLAVPSEIGRWRSAKRIRIERESWPMVIDQLISGVNAGISLQQNLRDLASRGPITLRKHFVDIDQDLQNGYPFDHVLRKARRKFATAAADQVLEVLVVARSSGSSDIAPILRTLGDFLRQESSLRAEIEARHGWVRSSAALAAMAPWLLLIILATQPSTRMAFGSDTGLYILGFGVVATAVAYLWMNVAGRLPEVPRALS